jgi:hypothetical protein
MGAEGSCRSGRGLYSDVIEGPGPAGPRFRSDSPSCRVDLRAGSSTVRSASCVLVSAPYGREREIEILLDISALSEQWSAGGCTSGERVEHRRPWAARLEETSCGPSGTAHAAHPCRGGRERLRPRSRGRARCTWARGPFQIRSTALVRGAVPQVLPRRWSVHTRQLKPIKMLVIMPHSGRGPLAVAR